MPTCSILPAGNMAHEKRGLKSGRSPRVGITGIFLKVKTKGIPGIQIDRYLFSQIKKILSVLEPVSVQKGLVSEATYSPIKDF